LDYTSAVTALLCDPRTIASSSTRLARHPRLALTERPRIESRSWSRSADVEGVKCAFSNAYVEVEVMGSLVGDAGRLCERGQRDAKKAEHARQKTPPQTPNLYIASSTADAGWRKMHIDQHGAARPHFSNGRFGRNSSTLSEHGRTWALAVTAWRPKVLRSAEQARFISGIPTAPYPKNKSRSRSRPDVVPAQR